MTQLGSKDIQGGLHLQPLANPPKLYACQFEVPSQQFVFINKMSLCVIL